MALIIFFYLGAAAAAIMLALSVGTLAAYVARGFAKRRAGDVAYGESLGIAFRYGIMAGIAAAWGVMGIAFMYFRRTRYVVIDNWWSVTWIFNGVVACAAALLLLAWFIRSIMLKVRGRIEPESYRKQMVAASCAYLCVWMSALAAYRWCWYPWFRACAKRTIEEENFDPRIAPALDTFVRQLSPEEEQELAVWMTRHERASTRFNAAYILAKRKEPRALDAAAEALARIESADVPRHGRYRFGVAYAKTALMQVTGFRAPNDLTPPTATEWDQWLKWYRPQGTFVNHVGKRK